MKGPDSNAPADQDARRVVEFGPVTATVRGRVGGVCFTRHEKRNAISAGLADAFVAAVEQLVADGVTVSTLSAEGSMFSAGADMSSHTQAGIPPTDRVIHSLKTSPIFWICALQGGAAGAGTAIALSCPIVVAAQEAWLWLPELSKLGRMPLGVLRCLSPLIGARAALALAVQEQRVSATRAMDAGWISAVVPSEHLSSTVDEYATKLAQSDEDALRAAAGLWSERSD